MVAQSETSRHRRGSLGELLPRYEEMDDTIAEGVTERFLRSKRR